MLLIDENDILKNEMKSCMLIWINWEKKIMLKEETKELKVRIEDLLQSLDCMFNEFNKSDKKLQMLVSSWKQDKS